MGEIGYITMGQSPSSDYYSSERLGLPLIQGNADMNNRLQIVRVYTSSITKSCDEGDIILSVRAPVGAVGKSIMRSCIGRGVCSIKSNNDFLYQYLLYMESFNMWSTYSTGSTFDSINSQKLYNICISYPANENEQCKIASCLSSVDDTINAYAEKAALLGQYKKGLMQRMFVNVETPYYDVSTGNGEPIGTPRCDVSTGNGEPIETPRCDVSTNGQTNVK